MKRNRTTRTTKPRARHDVDTWSIRAIIILQGTAVLLGILAGKTVADSAAVLEGFLKILELVTRVS